jgi:hypothetical protein
MEANIIFNIMKTRFMEKAETCSICYCQVEIQGKLDSCQHIFCFKCIHTWSEVKTIQTENTCPICKARFQTITRLSRRKFYKVKLNKAKNVTHVITKSQRNSLDFLDILQSAERILTHELYRLFQRSQGNIP